MSAHSVAAMRKWSCQTKTLPHPASIKAIHIYDFDNTLFQSPLPNPRIWSGSSMGALQATDTFSGGGWWQDENILKATGQGMEIEEPRAWAGFWNEDIVQLVDLSMQQEDSLTVLLTGRGEARFADLIKKMVASKRLDFDMICLKPQVGPTGQRFSNTMLFKQSLLEELIYTFRDAEEIRVYEDRPKHVRMFREFFEKINKAALTNSLPVARTALKAEVIQVSDPMTTLDPVNEVAEVQRMINANNAATPDNALHIKRTVFFTGYMLSASDTARILALFVPPSGVSESSLKMFGTNIMIIPRPAPPSVLEKVGGMGAKQIWQVNAIGAYQNAVWAARVAPIPSSATYVSENNPPIVVLACRRTAKPVDSTRIQQWQTMPADKQLVFETTVGEKVQLRVEPVIHSGARAHDSRFGTSKTSTASTGKRRSLANGGDDYGDRRDSSRKHPPSMRGRDPHRPHGGDRERERGPDSASARRDPYPVTSRSARDGYRAGGSHAPPPAMAPAIPTGPANSGHTASSRGGGSLRHRPRAPYRSLDDVPAGPRSSFANQEPDYGDEPRARARPGDYDYDYGDSGARTSRRESGGGGSGATAYASHPTGQTVEMWDY